MSESGVITPALFSALFIDELTQWLLRFNEALDVDGGGLNEIILEQISSIEKSRHPVIERIACQLELNYRVKIQEEKIAPSIQGLLQCSDPQYFIADMIHRDEENFSYVKQLGQVNVMYAIGVIRKALIPCSELMFNLSYPVRKEDLLLIMTDPNMSEILKTISQDRVRFSQSFSFAKCHGSILRAADDRVESSSLNTTKR